MVSLSPGPLDRAQPSEYDRPESEVSSVQTRLDRKFWTAMLIFGLMGQVAWVVENMYFNVFIYKMFHAGPGDISAMVMASAVTAALTTIVMGAASDMLGKRKAFMSVGYLIWGVTIISFAYIRNVTLTIVMDCVMTFFGSTANDAAYNAWLTDRGDSSNRGKIEGLNSMMPLVSILIVFGGFMGFDLDKASSWKTIYYIIGAVTAVIGVLGFFLIEDAPGSGRSAGYLADFDLQLPPLHLRAKTAAVRRAGGLRPVRHLHPDLHALPSHLL